MYRVYSIVSRGL